DHVIVMRLTKNGPAKIAVAARLGRERDAATRAIGNQLVMEGQALPHDPSRHSDERATGARFVAVVQAHAEGGRVRADGDALVGEEADGVTFLIAAASDVREKTAEGAKVAAERAIERASAKPLDMLRAAHIADYQRLFDRVNVILKADAAI